MTARERKVHMCWEAAHGTHGVEDRIWDEGEYTGSYWGCAQAYCGASGEDLELTHAGEQVTCLRCGDWDDFDGDAHAEDESCE